MEINKILTEIQKWVCLGSSTQCYIVMYAIVRSFQVKKIIEIGTHQGASSITFCQAILDNKYNPEIYTIDNWIGLPGNAASQNLKSKAENYIKNANFDKYITMIEGDSRIVVPELFKKTGDVDLCFIDGDHSYQGVIADYENCKNHTKLLLFHDTGTGEVGYLKTIEREGWKVVPFPTRYIEGNGHLVGITLCIKK